ncbi:MAG TPA: hypothetical protein VF141_07805 [Chryseolinea sp.]
MRQKCTNGASVRMSKNLTSPEMNIKSENGAGFQKNDRAIWRFTHQQHAIHQYYVLQERRQSDRCFGIVFDHQQKTSL